MRALTSKTIPQLLLLALCLHPLSLMSSVNAADHSPFQMNGWQFHEYDIPKLEEAICKAPVISDDYSYRSL